MTKILTVQLSNEDETIKDFIIKYDENSQEEAMKLQEKLIEHQLIFSEVLCGLDKISFIDSPDQTTLYISSIDGLKSYLKKRVKIIKDKTTTIISLKDKEQTATFLRGLLLELYQSLDIKVDNKEELTFFKGKENAIYDILAAHYYKDDSQYLNYLLEDSKQAKEEIFSWFNEQERFNLLNQLLSEQYQLLFQSNQKEEIRDSFLLKYLSNINEQLEQEILGVPILEAMKNYESSPLSQEELYSLTKDFFDTIDPTGEWSKKFEYYHENKIVYEEKEENSNVEWCSFRYNDEYVIIAPLTGKLSDFRDLVHEIAHLVSLESMTEDEFITPSLLEFPSIFLEFQALKFLQEKGYSSKFINNLYLERNSWTIASIMEVLPVLRLLERKMQAPITAESEETYSLSMIGSINDYTLEELDTISEYYPFIKEDIFEKCDETIDYLLQNPTSLYKTYPYTIGRYLAAEAMNKSCTDCTVVPKVLSIIPILKEETPESIISKLNLEIPLLKKQPTYVKTNKPSQN